MPEQDVSSAARSTTKCTTRTEAQSNRSPSAVTWVDAPSSTNVASGISASTSWASPIGVIESRAPDRISVGTSG